MAKIKKHAVQVNKANGQPYVNLSQLDNWEKGTLVEVREIQAMSEKDIQDWIDANKDKITEAQKELKEYFENLEVSPEYMFADYLKEKFQINNESKTGVCVDLKIGDTSVALAGDYYTDIHDSEDYIDFSNLDYEDPAVFKSEFIKGIDDETFTFDEKYFEKQNNLDASMKLFTYIQYQKNLKKQRDRVEQQILRDLGFEFYNWGGNFSTRDGQDIYKHKELDIYLGINLGFRFKDEFSFIDDSDEIEIVISYE